MKDIMINRRRFIGTLACVGGALALPGVARAMTQAQTVLPLDAAAFHGMRRFAKTPFGEIAYVERGTGAAALFLHGFPLNGFQWRGALPRLSPYRRCIAPDFLGMGFTRVADGQGVGPDDQVAMLVALLDELGVTAADVVANDSGGAVAQLLMLRHPDRVRSVLLTNCDTEIESPPSAMLPVIALARQGKYVGEWLAPWWKDKALARSSKGIGAMCYADPSHPDDEAIDMYFGPLLSTRRRTALADAYAVALERNALSGTESALQHTRIPVRVVWGRADTIFSPKNADYLDYACGGSRGIRWLEGSKLFWPEERPDVIAEEALRLWNARSSEAEIAS
ncbi:MAG TPA: alpha/beta hydrolase [Pseudoxanthomonas sp.]|nr:alpha/beta hydrolase [Pseudoxanthomonas sp.]